jgi:hypothetical protein
MLRPKGADRSTKSFSMFRSESNHLNFIGATGDEVLPVIAALHNLVHKQGFRDITLDFSKAGYLNPKFMLPLVTTARLYRGEKVDFEIIEPDDPSASRMLRNTNWAHLIWPEKYDSRDEFNQMHLSAIQYSNAND